MIIESELMVEIIDRAVTLMKKESWNITDNDITIMYQHLKLCHKTTPLNLEAFLHANDRDFNHEIWLITERLDIATGKLISEHFQLQFERD